MKQLRPYQQEIVDKIKYKLKTSSDPILINASVGSGKSLIISSILLMMEKAGMRALCLTLNSTLVQQNAETYKLQNGNYSIYAACLKSKCCKNLIVFATPNSISQGIRNKQEVSTKPFQIIIVDEVHNLNFHDSASMYMRIINHYSLLCQEKQLNFRFLGLTGTPYRGKGLSIVGENEFFKEQVCSISTSWLIEQGYLTKPHFGLTTNSIDFSDCLVNSMGNFNNKDLELALAKNERLTGEIMRELQTIKCNGIFIFASTTKHCEECARSLPEGQWAIITGDTKHEDRREIIERARTGGLHYLLSVNCLYVGIDIPFFDVCAWLRPTESLIIYTQGIGRVLRLHPDKQRAIVLDYAGNLERHGDIDDPIINEALKPTAENEKDYIIPCYTCGTNNTLHARRCIGIVGNSRCEHYFEFKDCPGCQTKNDITSRHCRECQAELIDPNAKLKRIKAETYTLNVIEAKYNISPQGYTSIPIINVAYRCQDGIDIYEHHYTNTAKSKNITYAKFIRLHVEKASDYYMHLSNIVKMKELIADKSLKTPVQLICTKNENGYYNIVKKVFD